MNRLATALMILIISNSFYSFGQNGHVFNKSHFPVHLIDSVIIQNRGLQEKINMLKNDCNWDTRIGKKIDVFWLKTTDGNYFGHVYEYFLDCDNLRLIYWYNNTSDKGKIVDFMIENLEDESMFVVSKRKHLKNKRRYRKYLETNSSN